jgi:hypothetical protein
MANRMGFEIRNLAIAALVPLALGACGSSSSTDRTVPPVEPPPTRASFDQVANQAKSLFDEQVDIDYTPVANVPVSGKATYSGAAAYKTDSNIPPDLGYPDYENAILTNPEFVSEVKLTANFESSSINGVFSNFHSAAAGPLDGGLRITNGTIDGGFFAGDVSGNVGVPGAVRPAIGTTSGDFVGDGAEYVLGYIALDSLAIESGERVYGVYTGIK